MNTRLVRCLAPSLLAALSGCAMTLPSDSPDTHRVLVLGFGLIETSAPAGKAVVSVESTALGLMLSDLPGLKASVGYASNSSIVVGSGVDVLVEADRGNGTLNVISYEPLTNNKE